MATPKTITSANNRLILTVAGLGLGPYVVEGYTPDASFAVSPNDVSESQMGVDGKMSAGFVPALKTMEVALQADSPSTEFFDAWLGGMEAVKELFFANGIVEMPSVNKSFICTKGALTRATKMAPGGKVLGPQAYTITFENVQPVPLAA